MIWDVPNLLVCLILILTALLMGKIELDHAFILVLISFTPLCLNYVLFDPAYMPDQFTYLNMLSSIRNLSYDPATYNSRVTEASYLYALLPLPFVETINSMGFFNKFLMISIFIWCAAVLKLRGWILWFLILYPSLLLYSSLGLRDLMICTFMLLALWALIRHWYVMTLICVAVLIQIKMQNALLVGMFSITYLANNYFKPNFLRLKVWVFILIIMLFLCLIFPYLLNKIEYYRIRMYFEDGGVYSNYIPIKNFLDFTIQSAQGIIRSLFCPLPWATSSPLQFLQSLENMVVVCLLIGFTWNSFKIIPNQTMLWLFFLLAGLLMYGLVVSNVGTIVRYKLPFIVVYFIFVSYERQRVVLNNLRLQSVKGSSEY